MNGTVANADTAAGGQLASPLLSDAILNGCFHSLLRYGENNASRPMRHIRWIHRSDKPPFTTPQALLTSARCLSAPLVAHSPAVQRRVSEPFVSKNFPIFRLTSAVGKFPTNRHQHNRQVTSSQQNRPLWLTIKRHKTTRCDDKHIRTKIQKIPFPHSGRHCEIDVNSSLQLTLFT